MRMWLLLAALTLAGCADAPQDQSPGTTPPGGGSGFAPQTGHDEDTDPKAPGLVLRGDMFTCPAGYCVNVTASNEGSRTYHISSICTTPWSESMQRDGKDVAHREPMAVCLAFGTGPFAPGDEASLAAEWNETLWNEAKDRYERAPQGGYDWSISFQAYDDADGGGSHELTVTFHVLVGVPT